MRAIDLKKGCQEGGPKMKTLKLLILMSVLIFLPGYGFSHSLENLRISLIDGDVQIRTEDTGEWVPASINMPLRGSDRVWVPEGGRTELHLIEGTLLRLDQESALEILTVEKDSFQFYLSEGRSYANFAGGRGDVLQIDTPLSSVRAYERADFGIDVSRSGQTTISVYRGFVYAENQSGKTRVEAGNGLSVAEGYYAELFPLGLADEWETWNRNRDRQLAQQRPPSRYLPEELYGYSNDFDDYGTWAYVTDYGYVWRPTVVVSAGWAPYQVGRWVWMAGDYVWVSYEPWGWVPYHYGRWAFVVSIGWCWVPPVHGAIYWGPGFVGWVYIPTYVAWVPLAPGEIYYGHGYYGPHSVNITNVNITNIYVQNTVFKNVNVHKAVTAVPRDTFASGKHKIVEPKENPFLSKEAHSGRPNVTLDKNMAKPVVREIAEIKKPPQTVRQIQVKELKEKRPLVKEKEASVFKPGSLPKEMSLKRVERKEVERSKEIKQPEKSKEIRPPEKGKQTTPTIRPSNIEPVKPEKAKSPQEKAQNLSLFRPQERVTTGNSERSTEKKIEKTTERRETIKPTQKEVVKPQTYQPVQKPVEAPRENKPLIKEVQKPTEPRAVEKEVRPRESVLSERNREAGAASSRPQQGLEKSRNPAAIEGGAKTTPPETQYGRETKIPQGTKTQVQQTPGSRISVRGTVKPSL
jgi:hypothetical protein